MNTKLIKFYLKNDLIVTLSYMLGLSIIIYTIALVVDSQPALSVYINAINSGFPFVAFGCFIGIYFITLNKTAQEQWENFSLTKNEKFNLLAIRYAVTILIPQTLILVLAGYLNKEMEAEVFSSFIPWVLLPALNYVFFMCFTLISGNIATAAIGMSFSSIISEVIIEKQIANNTRIDSEVLWALTLIFICIMFFVNKKIFKQREVEKLGRMFLFRWAEVVFAIGIAVFISATLNAILMNSGTVIMEYIFIAFATTLVYVLTDTLVLTSLKIEKLKVKITANRLLKQFCIGIATSIIVSVLFAIYF